jgi:bcr-type benzoyl-CoA reductase subunit C
MGVVTAWKARNPNGKAIGFFPTYVPLEPIYAMGGLPAGLWGGDIPMGLADAYIQQFTCSIVRSLTEYALSGRLAKLDAVLIPPICDSVKLVGSIWQLNFSDRFLVDMANLPQRLDSPSAVPYLAAELRRVSECLAGAPATESALASAAKLCNRLRKAQQAFCDWRANRAIPLAEASMILRAGTILHAEEYCPLVEEAIADGTPEAAPRGIPVVVSGLSCQLPHPQVMECFEEVGLRVVEDDLFLGLRGGALVPDDGDAYAAIAGAYCDSAPMAIRHAEGEQRHERLLDQIDRTGAKGIVYMVPKFCEPEWFDLRYLREETNRRGIPSIVIDFEEGHGATGPVQTRLAAFAETLE